jgi:hypothetical protein
VRIDKSIKILENSNTFLQLAGINSSILPLVVLSADFYPRLFFAWKKCMISVKGLVRTSHFL